MQDHCIHATRDLHHGFQGASDELCLRLDASPTGSTHRIPLFYTSLKVENIMDVLTELVAQTLELLERELR